MYYAYMTYTYRQYWTQADIAPFPGKTFEAAEAVKEAAISNHNKLAAALAQAHAQVY